MKKTNKFLNILTTMLILMLCQNQAQAISTVVEKAKDTTATINTTEILESESEVIKKFSFKNKLQRTPEAQIRSFYKNFNKYTQKNEIDKLKEMYSDSYINNDGFDKHTIFTMAEKASGAYKDIEYKTTIEKISVDGNYAVVDVNEFAIGSTANEHEEIGDTGLVSSDLYYTDYLQKEGNKWKIIATTMRQEKVALKYGETKGMPIEVIAPKLVPENTEYTVKVKTDTPNGCLVVGSIVNEPIVYPQVQKKDNYRSVKSGELERVLRANKDGNNEYAAITLGITRATIEPPEVVFNMTGMAFIITRVNIYKKNVKEDKEINDVKVSLYR